MLKLALGMELGLLFISLTSFPISRDLNNSTHNVFMFIPCVKTLKSLKFDMEVKIIDCL